jgi:hypothetical protein
MIAQGTNGLSWGTFLERVAAGKDMLSFVYVACTAVERHPAMRQFVESWLDPMVGAATWLQLGEWFFEGRNHRSSTRPSWDLDPNPCKKWQSVHMDATSNHSRRSSQRVPQGQPQGGRKGTTSFWSQGCTPPYGCACFTSCPISCFNSHLALCTGLPPCTTLYLLALPFHL